MGGKKKGVKHRKLRPSEKKRYLLKPMKSMEQDVKEYLLPGEHVLYQAHEMFFTDRRVIKHKHGWAARTFHYFYSTFEDLDLRFLESVKAKNVINLRLLFWGLFVMLLGPISMVIAAVPGLGWLGSFLMEFFVEGLALGGLLLIGFLLIIAGLILRDRVIEFRGMGGTTIMTRHLHDAELVKVRELQYLRWRSMGLDK
ncbi:hypothetical protein GF367_01205 [Candidatus Woesearchaeota archaeon]|nr:hypothetical protein [Candidatus Woesearchaeota archaeon]